MQTLKSLKNMILAKPQLGAMLVGIVALTLFGTFPGLVGAFCIGWAFGTLGTAS